MIRQRFQVFHIGNLHHLIFPFRRLVVLDLDLVFEVDIADQYREFESMERDDRLVAITYDQAQHYWVQFQRFRKKHHGTRYTKVSRLGTSAKTSSLYGIRFVCSVYRPRASTEASF